MKFICSFFLINSSSDSDVDIETIEKNTSTMEKNTFKRKKRRKTIGLYQSKSKRCRPNVPVVVHEVVNITAQKKVNLSNIPASA